MRFLLDEDLNPVIAEASRGLGMDVLSVHEIGRRGLGDREQIALAAADERVFVTRNRDDYIRLTVALYQSGGRHPGVIIVPYSLPNNAPERIAHALKRWMAEHRDAALDYAIFFLES